MTVRLGIVGGGVIGHRHARSMKEVAEAELVAVADPAPSGQGLANEMAVPLYQSTAEMLAAENLDGVIVSTPTEYHAPPTLEALDAGVHVLVEKPIMPTLEQAEATVAKSEEKGLNVLVGHHRRYYPLVLKARDIVQSGELGDLVAVSGIWSARKNKSYYDQDWRKKWEAGPVLTNLIHEMDYLRFNCGELESLSAEVSHKVWNFEKEDAAAMVLKFTNGAIGTFVVSDQATSPWAWEFSTGETPAFPKTGQNCIRFIGTKAALDFPNLTLWHHDGQTPDWNHAMMAEEMQHNMINAYADQIAHFCAVIQGKEEPRITARDATATLRATLAVFDAAKTGQRIML